MTSHHSIKRRSIYGKIITTASKMGLILQLFIVTFLVGLLQGAPADSKQPTAESTTQGIRPLPAVISQQHKDSQEDSSEEKKDSNEDSIKRDSRETPSHIAGVPTPTQKPQILPQPIPSKTRNTRNTPTQHISGVSQTHQKPQTRPQPIPPASSLVKRPTRGTQQSTQEKPKPQVLPQPIPPKRPSRDTTGDKKDKVQAVPLPAPIHQNKPVLANQQAPVTGRSTTLAYRNYKI